MVRTGSYTRLGTEMVYFQQADSREIMGPWLNPSTSGSARGSDPLCRTHAHGSPRSRNYRLRTIMENESKWARDVPWARPRAQKGRHRVARVHAPVPTRVPDARKPPRGLNVGSSGARGFFQRPCAGEPVTMSHVILTRAQCAARWVWLSRPEHTKSEGRRVF